MCVVTNETIEEDEDEEDDVSIDKNTRCDTENYQRDDKKPAHLSPWRLRNSEYAKKSEKQV